MTCPDLDTVLDAGFDLPADVRAHLASCAACSAELASAAALAAGFAEMRAETAPPGLVDAALAAARAEAASRPAPARRRAPDRAARPAPRRRAPALLAACVLGVLLLAAGVWVLRDGTPRASGDLVAEAPVRTDRAAAPPAPSAPPPLEGPVAEAQELPAPPAEPTESAPLGPPPSTPPPAPPVPRPTPAPAVQEASPAFVAEVPLPDSVAAARDGALLALSLVADAQRVAGRTLTHEAQRLGTALSDAVGS